MRRFASNAHCGAPLAASAGPRATRLTTVAACRPGDTPQCALLYDALASRPQSNAPREASALSTPERLHCTLLGGLGKNACMRVRHAHYQSLPNTFHACLKPGQGLEIEANFDRQCRSAHVTGAHRSVWLHDCLVHPHSRPLLRKFLCARTPRVEQRARTITRAARAMAAGICCSRFLLGYHTC